MEFMIKADEIDIDDYPLTGLDPEANEALRESMKEYCIKYPLIVYKKENGRYAIIDGTARFKIGTELGIRKFRCIVENIKSRPPGKSSEK